jgi:transcription termination/antitermination protein NusG
MCSSFQEEPVPRELAAATASTSWFAVQTKPRHEKKVAAELAEKGVTVFLPLVSETHQWSDRKRELRLPLFTHYVFTRIGGGHSPRVTVLRTNGVLGFVGVRGSGTPIPNEQIETLQRILSERVPFTPHPFLTVGQRVRIRGGSLDGIHGLLLAVNNDWSLILSVDGIQRSLAIRIDGYGVEPA